MGIGGSSNTVLHLTAIAHEAGIELPAQKFDEISHNTPYIACLSPAGHHHIVDLNEAGGYGYRRFFQYCTSSHCYCP